MGVEAWEGWRGEGVCTGCDVADSSRVAVAVVDEEGDDPAGDGDFGALVGEDEESAEEGCFVADGLLQQLDFGLFVCFGCCPARCGSFERGEELDGHVLFVGTESPPGENEVEGRHAEGDEVEVRPDDAVSDHAGGHEWADGTSNAVAAVEGAEGGGAVDEVGAENVVKG